MEHPAGAKNSRQFQGVTNSKANKKHRKSGGLPLALKHQTFWKDMEASSGKILNVRMRLILGPFTKVFWIVSWSRRTVSSCN